MILDQIRLAAMIVFVIKDMFQSITEIILIKPLSIRGIIFVKMKTNVKQAETCAVTMLTVPILKDHILVYAFKVLMETAETVQILMNVRLKVKLRSVLMAVEMFPVMAPVMTTMMTMELLYTIAMQKRHA